MTPRLLNRKEAAEYLGVGLTTFQKLAQRLPILKCGNRTLWDRVALDEFVSQFGAGQDISVDKRTGTR